MKIFLLASLCFLAVAALAYGWGALCNVAFDKSVAVVPAMIGGGLIGWLGTGLIIKRAKKLS